MISYDVRYRRRVEPDAGRSIEFPIIGGSNLQLHEGRHSDPVVRPALRVKVHPGERQKFARGQ